jgi:hypothetical protein
LLLIKRICQELRKPLFEVLEFPSSELEWWSCVFSIDANGDKPIAPKQTVEESIALAKKLFK